MQEIYNNKVYEDAGGNSVSSSIKGALRSMSRTPSLVDGEYRYSIGGASITPLLDRINICLTMEEVRGRNPYNESITIISRTSYDIAFNATNFPQGYRRVVFDIPDADIKVVIGLKVDYGVTHYKLKPQYQYVIFGYSTGKPVKVKVDLFNLTGINISKNIDGKEYRIKTSLPLYLAVYTLYQTTK